MSRCNILVQSCQVVTKACLTAAAGFPPAWNGVLGIISFTQEMHLDHKGCLQADS